MPVPSDSSAPLTPEIAAECLTQIIRVPGSSKFKLPPRPLPRHLVGAWSILQWRFPLAELM
eukprot:3932510-Rhodomonas_salina.1